MSDITNATTARGSVSEAIVMKEAAEVGELDTRQVASSIRAHDKDEGMNVFNL